MIKPTIGRKVWYHPSCQDESFNLNDREQPLDATIVYVWNERMVNLLVVDHHGHTQTRTSVKLLQDDDMPSEGHCYARWMPYQTRQAEKDKDTRPVGIGASGEVVRMADLVEWKGGDCPVDGDAWVEVIFRGMWGKPDGMSRASALNWAHQGNIGDIVAYRVALENGGAGKPHPPVSSAGYAPRVTPEQIEALMERVIYTFEIQPLGSTTTLCHAFLDGTFFLASGISNCISPQNYNEETGCNMAQTKAEHNARDKLWELEGYALYSILTGRFDEVVLKAGSVTIEADNVTLSGDVLVA